MNIFHSLVVVAALVALCSAQTPGYNYTAYNYRRDYTLTPHNLGGTRKNNRYEGWELLEGPTASLSLTYDGTKYSGASGAWADGTSFSSRPSSPVTVRYRFRQNWNQLTNQIRVTRTTSATATYASWSNINTGSMAGTSISASHSGGTLLGGDFSTDAAYLNSYISSSPSTPNQGLQFHSSSTHTFTFSPAVERPLAAIASLGQAGLAATLTFNYDFEVLSQGVGNWGSGPYVKSGNSITGNEWHGLIRFKTTIATLTASYPSNEAWSALTFGKVDDAATVTFGLNANPPYWTALLSKGESASFNATVTGAPVVLENEFFDLKTTVTAAPVGSEKFNLEWKIIAPCNEPCTCFYCTTEFLDFCPTVEPTPAPTPAEYQEEICLDAWDECLNIYFACLNIEANNAGPMALDCSQAPDNASPHCQLEALCFELWDVCIAFANHCDLEVEGCPQ